MSEELKRSGPETETISDCSGSYWDEKITLEQFYRQELFFGNSEIDMHDVPPRRVKILFDS
ncbi:MAG: hypothetical protein HQL76_11025 [Magnetococcales bacterium]|nr:hypothetical protein [Magnetococcales bacterium]